MLAQVARIDRVVDSKVAESIERVDSKVKSLETQMASMQESIQQLSVSLADSRAVSPSPAPAASAPFVFGAAANTPPL